MNDLLYATVIISASFIIGLITSVIASFLISRWDRFFSTKKFKIRLTHIRKPFFFLIPAVFVLVGVQFTLLSEKAIGLISHALTLYIIAACGWFFVKVIYIARDIILDRYDFGARDNLKARAVYTQTRVISSLLIGAIIILAVSFVLMTFSAVRQIGVSLLASAGILGVILGFAAQKTLGNVIAGIQIALAQPIRLDDAVVLENEWGWIEEITLTYVVVRIWDLRRLVVPISYFLEKPFQNWTRTSADILGSVFMYADYTIPVEDVRAELGRILKESPYWNKKVNVLQVTNTNERTVELRALMSAADSPTAWNLRCEVREKLLGFLQKEYPGSLPKTRIELQKA